MAKRNLKEKALDLRSSGKSYSEIKKEIKVSKSTLSLWLRDFPLGKDRLKEIRDFNPRRIESYRITMQNKKNDKLNRVFKNVSNKIGCITERDILIGGIFLYMGEGSKTTRGSTIVTNTNPLILKLFLRWLFLHNVPKNKIKIQLHLYKDMDIKKELDYWSHLLNLPNKQFRKPHIKNSNLSSLSFKSSYGHGTCSIIYENIDMHNTTMSYLKYIQEYF